GWQRKVTLSIELMQAHAFSILDTNERAALQPDEQQLLKEERIPLAVHEEALSGRQCNRSAQMFDGQESGVFKREPARRNGDQAPQPVQLGDGPDEGGVLLQLAIAIGTNDQESLSRSVAGDVLE